MVLVVCPLCGEERKHYARGLCQRHWQKVRDAGKLHLFTLGRRAPRARVRRYREADWYYANPSRREYQKEWQRKKRQALREQNEREQNDQP